MGTVKLIRLRLSNFAVMGRIEAGQFSLNQTPGNQFEVENFFPMPELRTRKLENLKSI